jgi:hypothetical protein
LAFCEVHPNGVLGIAHAGVREARGRMARRMHRDPLSVVRSWKTSTGACIWKQSGRPPSPRATKDRRTDDPHPPLYARIEARAFCQGTAQLGNALRPSPVLRIQSATFVDIRVGWCTIGVHDPHCNTNPSAFRMVAGLLGRAARLIRRWARPTVQEYTSGKDSKCCRGGKNHAGT